MIPQPSSTMSYFDYLIQFLTKKIKKINAKGRNHLHENCSLEEQREKIKLEQKMPKVNDTVKIPFN